MRRLALFLFLLLAGCGFHLRGQYSMAPELKILHLSIPKDATLLSQEIERMLELSGVKTGDGAYTLVVTQENVVQQASIYNPQVQVENVHVIYTLAYFLVSKDGKQRFPGNPIVEQNDYQTAPNLISGANAEADQLIADMRRDAVQQLGHRLAAIKPSQLDGATPAPASSSGKGS